MNTTTLLRTIPFCGGSGSAADPLASEITWQAWELTAADPARMCAEVIQHVTIGFDCLVEAAWQPGRSVVLSEAEWVPASDGRGRLAVRLAIGVLGAAGDTASEVLGLRARAEDVLRRHHVFSATPIDPTVVVAACNPAAPFPRAVGHMAHIRQRTATVGDDQDLIEVVSRYSPTVEPWTSVVAQLAALDQHVRVRATVLATELSPADRLELEAGLTRVSALRNRNSERTEILFDADRAEATLLDLRASLSSPIVVAEIAVWSATPLAHTALRSLAAAFTSETDVLRRQGHVVVASNRLLLGGFALIAEPVGWELAQHQGLPLRGGIRPRELVDLLTLTESPVGWPLPINGPLPATPTLVPVNRPVPALLHGIDGVGAAPLGRVPGGPLLWLPAELRTRHLMTTGTWGAGKSSLLLHQARHDLDTGGRFLFIDPHGSAADQLVAHASSIGLDPVIIDASDGATDQISILPSDDIDDHEAVERATRRFADAVASSLQNPEWTGPRWFSTFEALLELVVVHRGELLDGVVWMNDLDELRSRLRHPGLSPFARSTLSNLAASSNDGAEIRGWVTSKLHPVVSGSVRRIVAPAGHGIDLAAAVAAGRPVIVSLASLSTTEGNLVGHLTLAAVLDDAFQHADPSRPLLTCYLDEAHRFPASGMARAFAEGRKFSVSLAMAVQSLGQLPAELVDLAMGAGTQVAFRATPDTAARLSPVLRVPPLDLLGQPDLHATVVVQGQPAASLVVDPPKATRDRRRVALSPLSKPQSDSDRPTMPARPSVPSTGFLHDLLARPRPGTGAATSADEDEWEPSDQPVAN